MGRPLDFEALLNTRDFEQGINRIENQIKGITETAKNETNQIDDAFKKLSVGIGAYFSANALQGFTQQLIQVRGEFQKTEIAFATMLKSHEKAKVLMADMVDLAARTPFGLQEVSDGAKRLLAFQIPANEVVDTLKRMGDVAAGLGVPMGQLIHVYGQVKAQGKLMTNDLYQFMNAGIPILAELGNVLGKTEAEVKAMVGEGKIGFTEIQQVIQSMTNEGGLFFNLMEKQSASLSGKVSNLQDAFDQMLNKIGESQEELLSGGIDGLTYLVEHYEDVVRVLKVLVATYGAYRAALILTAVTQQTVATPQIVQGFINLIRLIRGATVAQGALNAVSIANPYILLATAIAGLVAVLYNLNDGLSGAERAAKTLQERFSEQKKNADNYKGSIKSLIETIKDETTTQREKAESLAKLQDLYPEMFANMDVQKVKALDLIEVEKQLNQEIEKRNDQSDAQYLEELKARLEGLKEIDAFGDIFGTNAEEIENIQRQISELEQKERERNEVLKLQNMTLEEQVEYWKKEDEAIKKTIEAIKNKHPELAKINFETGQLPKGIDAFQNAINSLSFKSVFDRIRQIKRELKNVEGQVEGVGNEKGEPQKKDSELTQIDIDSKLDALRKKKKEISNGNKEALKEVNNEIEKYLKLNEKYKDPDIKPKKEKKPTKSEINKPIKGSLGALEQELSELNIKINNKTLINDEKTRATLLKRREELEKRIAEIKKQYEKQSFDNELAETERQWRVRYLLAEKYGKEIANKQFPNLKGESYRDEMQRKFNVLDDKAKSGVSLSDEELSQWQKLKTILDDLAGVKDPFTNFKEGLDKSLEGLNTYTAKIDFLKNKLNNLSGKEKDFGAEREIKSQLEAVEREYKQYYDSFLKEHQTFKERQEEIDRKYDELRAKAVTDAEKKKIDNAEKKEKSELELDIFKQSGDWELAFGELEYLGSSTINRLIKRMEEFKKAKGETLQPTEIKELNDAISKLRVQAERNPIKGVINGLKDLKKAKEEAKKASEEYEKTLNDETKSEEEQIKAGKKLAQKEEEYAKTKKKIAENLGNTQEYFNATIEGISDVADAFGGLDDATKDTLEDIANVGNALLDLGQSIAKGDIAGIVKSAFKAIGSIAKAFSGDKRKERNIKREKQALEGLKTAYEDLAYAANKAFGDKKYSSQTDLVKNLEQQKTHLDNMIREEQSKKKTDHGKIADWQNQISAINRSIDDIKTSVIKDVLQTDVVDAATKVGDALVDAFGRGEDAAKSLENVANDLIKNMLKNQLNLKIQEKMKPHLDSMLNAMGFDKEGKGVFKKLDKSKIEEFKEQIKNSGKQLQDFLEQYREIFSTTEGLNDSLKGGIKGMSEETANVLAGQFNAIRINTGEILKNQGFGLDLMRQSVGSLIKIEQNTFNLYQMRKDLSELNSKVSNGRTLKAKGVI